MFEDLGDDLRCQGLMKLMMVGMGDKTIRTALCPGGAERMKRLMRLVETGRVDPLPLTTHRFRFEEVEQAFRLMERKGDGIIKPLLTFE